MMDLIRWDGFPTPEEWQAVGAMATALIALFAAMIAIRQYKISIRNQLEQARPLITVDFQFLGSLIACVEVTNTGLTAAYAVRFTWNHLPIAMDERSQRAIDKAMVENGIPFLAPGKKIIFLLNRYDDDAPTELPRRYEVTAKYRGPENSSWESMSILDVDQWAMAIIERDRYESITQQLKKLVEASQKQKLADQHLADAAESVNTFLEASPRVQQARAKHRAEHERRLDLLRAREAKRQADLAAQRATHNDYPID